MSEAAATAPPKRILCVVFCYNERVKIRRTLGRFARAAEWDTWVMDDGSTDGCTDGLEAEFGVRVVRHARNRGAGAAVRTVLEEFVASSYDAVVLVAGNDKDRPEDVLAVAEPVLRGEADIVQGSRYLPGGEFGNMPRYRMLGTRVVHPALFAVASGQFLSDTTNGFRAVGRRVLTEGKIDLSHPRLDRYELEPYFLCQAIRKGYRVLEAPVRKIYPEHSLGYTKMRPVVDWWRIMRPLVYVKLGVWR